MTETPATAQPLLDVQHLEVVYRGRRLWPWKTVGRLTAVRDLSFQIAAGETFALVGESGSGKSTVARAVEALEVRMGVEAMVPCMAVVLARACVAMARAIPVAPAVGLCGGRQADRAGDQQGAGQGQAGQGSRKRFHGVLLSVQRGETATLTRRVLPGWYGSRVEKRCPSYSYVTW